MTREDAIKELQESLDTLREYDIAHSSRLKQALEMAVQALSQEPKYYPPCEDCHKRMDEIRRAYDKLKEQEPCDDAISRDAVDKYIARLLSGYLYDGERERLEIFILTPKVLFAQCHGKDKNFSKRNVYAKARLNEL